MVWQREVLGYKYERVASNLNVDLTTVWRVVKLFKETGNVKKKVYPKDKASRRLTTPLELTVLHIVLQHPGIYLREIQTELFELTGAAISYSSICRLLSRVGFTRQKMKYAALQRDMRLRSQFVSDVSVYNHDMLIFLDESGLDKCDGMLQYGYSLCGSPPVCQRFLARGTHISLIAFRSTAGVLDCKLMQGGVDGDVFYEFVETFLLPHLMPF